MQGIRAGDINRLNRVALRHRFQRGKTDARRDTIIAKDRACSRLRECETGGEPEFAGFIWRRQTGA